jgi:uncharacterized protein YeeX (DUF496 family)
MESNAKHVGSASELKRKIAVMDSKLRDTRRRMILLERDVSDLCEDMMFIPEYRPPKEKDTPRYIG